MPKRRRKGESSPAELEAALDDLVSEAEQRSSTARKQDERVWGFILVVPLALEKRLFLNASCRCLLVPLLGKKYCDINKRLTSF
jgi:hypothetical protein